MSLKVTGEHLVDFIGDVIEAWCFSSCQSIDTIVKDFSCEVVGYDGIVGASCLKDQSMWVVLGVVLALGGDGWDHCNMTKQGKLDWEALSVKCMIE